MASWGDCDFEQLLKLRDKLANVDQLEDEFCRACAKELAARLLRKVIKRTPVGQYSKASGKKGGTLRRGWTTQKGLKVVKQGHEYIVEIINDVFYAAYVEYGHRTPDHKGWVKGKFMLTISEQELNNDRDAILQRKLEKFLKEVFNDK